MTVLDAIPVLISGFLCGTLVAAFLRLIASRG